MGPRRSTTTRPQQAHMNTGIAGTTGRGWRCSMSSRRDGNRKFCRRSGCGTFCSCTTSNRVQCRVCQKSDDRRGWVQSTWCARPTWPIPKDISRNCSGQSVATVGKPVTLTQIWSKSLFTTNSQENTDDVLGWHIAFEMTLSRKVPTTIISISDVLKHQFRHQLSRTHEIVLKI